MPLDGITAAPGLYTGQIYTRAEKTRPRGRVEAQNTRRALLLSPPNAAIKRNTAVQPREGPLQRILFYPYIV